MRLTAVIVLLIGCGTLSAQVDTRRAEMRGGGGGDGKCTIEVEVDDVAEVEVSGDMARIRTLQGNPAVFRRFVCNGVMPRNPGDFRFRGIDGRGDVRLVRDPRGGGPAVVRIVDSRGGREGYTFDLEWRGGTSGFGGGGFGGGRYDDRNDDRSNRGRSRYDRDDRFDNRGGGGGNRYRMETAVRDCQDAVATRLERNGYRDVQFDRIVPDNNPGRNDWVIGTVQARRDGGRRDSMSFSCSVDFNNGRIRSVDIDRR